MLQRLPQDLAGVVSKHTGESCICPQHPLIAIRHAQPVRRGLKHLFEVLHPGLGVVLSGPTLIDPGLIDPSLIHLSLIRPGWISPGWIDPTWLDPGWLDVGWLDPGWMSRREIGSFSDPTGFFRTRI